MSKQAEIEFGTLPTITKAVIENSYRVPIFNDGTLRWSINDELTGKGLCSISFQDAADHKHPQFQAYIDFQRSRAQQIADLINAGIAARA